MTSHEQLANAQNSPGPRTPEGKAVASPGGLTFGHFTMRDFIQPHEEEDEFGQIAATYWADLQPQTILEETYVTAIISAAWRLRRCSKVEAGMAGFFGLDPMEDAVGQRTQTSVDRARSQSFNILRRSTDELRRLQTDRAIRRELHPDEARGDPATTSGENDLTSHQQLISSLTHAKRAKLLIFKPDTPLNPLPAQNPDPLLASNCKEPVPPPL